MKKETILDLGWVRLRLATMDEKDTREPCDLCHLDGILMCQAIKGADGCSEKPWSYWERVVDEKEDEEFERDFEW